MKTLKSIIITATLATTLCNGSVAGQRVLLVAGKPSHADGEHEFPKGVHLLAKCINESGLDMRADWRLGIPDRAELLEYDALIVYSDGGRDNPMRERVPDLRDFLAQGCGLGILHYALEPHGNELRNFLDDTIGGHFAPNHSVNPTWELRSPILNRHPVTRGVEMGPIRDEWYYHIRFARAVTPLLQAHPPADTLGKDGPRSGNPSVRQALADGIPQTLAWCREDEDGQRFLGFTGGHYHHNWDNPGYRKLALNAIAWLAGAEVPTQGVPSKITPIPRTPSIDHAIALGDLADVKRHLAADPNRLEKGLNPSLNPLQQAILRKKSEIALHLIDSGADIDAADGSQRSPLHLAVERGLPTLLIALLEHGATTGRLDKIGWTPLQHAAAKDQVELVRILLDGGADPNQPSARGGTALHEAAASGSPAITRMLLEAGVDPAVVSATGQTALSIAKEYENHPVADLISSALQE